jgi:predicted DsbA family dithiol-disulfide isomerase
MAEPNLKIVLYHSIVCPRCAVSTIALHRVLKKHPGVELEMVEFLTNRARARMDGVRSIPALAAQGRSLTGMLLTAGRIEKFIESLSTETV